MKVDTITRHLHEDKVINKVYYGGRLYNVIACKLCKKVRIGLA